MSILNGATPTTDADTSHAFEALKADLKHLVNQLELKPRSYLGRASDQIKTRPLAAVGIAFGLGYLAVRLARRK